MEWQGKGFVFPFLPLVFPLRLIGFYLLPHAVPGGSSRLTCTLKKPHETPHPSEHRLALLPASEAIFVYLRTLRVDHASRPGFALKKMMYQSTNPKSL